MGKTRDHFKKIRDTKGTFHAKMGTIKDRNGMDLTQAEDIKRGGKNKQKNYTKKNFSSVQFSRSVVSDSLRPHELQHVRPPCSSPSLGVHSD